MAAFTTYSGNGIGNATVGATSTLIKARDTRRTYLIICNTSADTAVWISIGVAAELNKGIYLPAGATYEMNTTNMSEDAVYGISTGSVLVSWQTGL